MNSCGELLRQRFATAGLRDRHVFFGADIEHYRTKATFSIYT